MDTKAYILDLLITSILLIYTFFMLAKKDRDFTIANKITLSLLLIPIFLLQIFVGDWSNLFFIISIYYLLKDNKYDYLLIDILIISLLIIDLSNIFTSLIILVIHSGSSIVSYKYLIISVISIFLLIHVFIHIYKKYKINNLLKKFNHISGFIILCYLLATISFFMSLVQKYEAYKSLVVEIILFLALQSALVIFLFIYDRKRQTEKHKQVIIEEKSKNLELYTQSLEQEQLKLRKFKHDYKNMIVSLRSFTSQIPELDDTINKFEDYSGNYFKGQFLNQYKDLGNVENSYLKSLLISKFHTISLNEIKCSFECRDKINDLPINIFDLIRLLGISIDNAIEETKAQANGIMNIVIIKKDKQTIFLINNTSPSDKSVYELMEEGYSTKKGHSGFGLSNIQEIKKKYPDNIISKYEKSDGWFKLELLLK